MSANFPTRLAWRYPEAWPLALCAIAWVLMVRAHEHAAHVHGLTPLLQNWFVMTVAMMLPMVVPPLRLTARRSFWRRRHLAMAEFLAGYVGCWMLVGVAVAFLPMSRIATAIGLAIAAAWQLTRWKQRGLAGCHLSVPLAPKGWRADRDCMRFGWRIGTRCVVSCWALMLVCFLSGHALLATLLVVGVGVAERYSPRTANQKFLAAVLFAAAILYLP
jgi:predicted metal-binding membrane protein